MPTFVLLPLSPAIGVLEVCKIIAVFGQWVVVCKSCSSRAALMPIQSSGSP
jgi:hypothetical protein